MGTPPWSRAAWRSCSTGSARRSAESRILEHHLASGSGRLQVCTEPPADAGSCQVLYWTAPIDDLEQLHAVLDNPCHLVIGQTQAYRNRALLFAAAHAAQAVVTSSEEERAALAAELALDAAKVEIVASETALASVFRSDAERT